MNKIITKNCSPLIWLNTQNENLRSANICRPTLIQPCPAQNVACLHYGEKQVLCRENSKCKVPEYYDMKHAKNHRSLFYKIYPLFGDFKSLKIHFLSSWRLQQSCLPLNETWLFFHSSTVHSDVIQSFICPTNAKPVCFKILKFTLKYIINAPTCFSLTKPSSGSLQSVFC